MPKNKQPRNLKLNQHEIKRSVFIILLMFIFSLKPTFGQRSGSININFEEEKTSKKVLPHKIDFCPIKFGAFYPQYFLHGGLVDSTERLIVLQFSLLHKKSKLVIIDLETKTVKSIIPIRDLIYFSNSYFYGNSLYLKRPVLNAINWTLV